MKRKTRSQFALWTLIFMLLVQVLAPGKAVIADGVDEGLVLTFSASSTEVKAGEEFSYIINYSASSIVSDFTDPKITFTLPAGVTYTNKSDSSLTTSTVTDSVQFPGRKEVTFSFKGGVLPAGSTGQLLVKGYFENYVTPDGTTATASCTFHATADGTPVSLESNEVEVTASAEAKWVIEKKKIRPLPEPYKDSDVEYEIMLRENAASTYGRLHSKNFIVTDILPDGAVFVSASLGGAYDPVGNKVVWNLGNDLKDSTRLTVIVNYPNSIVESEVTNRAEATFTPIGKSQTTISHEVTHGFETSPVDNGSGISKSTNASNKEISPGQTVKFQIGSFENRANVQLNSATIVDMTPTKTESGADIALELQSVRTATFAGILSYDVDYTLVENPAEADWTHWKSVSAAAAETLNASSLGAVTVKGIRFRFGNLPINFIQSNNFETTYKVPAGFTVPDDRAETVNNVVNLSYEFSGTTKTATSHSSFDIVGKRPLINLKKVSSKTSLKPTESTTYTITATNVNYSSDELVNPMIIDYLPADLEYTPGTSKVTKPNGITSDPHFLAEPQPDGTTKMTWWWDDQNPGNLQIDKTIIIAFDATIKPGVQQKMLKNKVLITSPNYLNDTKFSNNKKCPGCHPDGSEYSIEQEVAVQVIDEVSLQATMWVKGELDTDWTKSGKTTPGGSALYKLEILNVGNVTTKNLVIVNKFPRIGDSSVINDQPRQSEWGPLLTGKVAAPDYVKVLYSTKDGITMDPRSGTDTGVWSEEPPQDLTSVTAVKFEFADDFVINPLDKTTLQWSMVAPVGAPTTGEIAWNSFGYKMNKSNGGFILPAEPNRVGIEIQSSPKAEIGNYVWIDQNEDGIQDVAETGVNGIKVELYDDSGNKLSETLTGNDFTGKPGYYLFPNLDAGNYSVVFTPSPTFYEGLTAAGKGADPEKDSNADPLTGKTSMITLADGEKNHSVDAGVILKKGSIGDYVWIDSNENGIQDVGEKGLNGVTVELYNESSQLLATKTTSTNGGNAGYYLFDKLSPGKYKVKFTPSPAYGVTDKNQGGDPSKDSDVDPVSRYTDTITLAQGEENMTIDAGLIKLPLGSIGDFVWLDENRNGIQDPTEKGLNNIKVLLYDNQNKPIKQTVTADHNGKPGYYLFDDLEAGDYSLRFVLPYPVTKSKVGDPSKDSDVDASGRTDLITLQPGDHIDTIDAGVYQEPWTELPKGSIGDRVWIDSNKNGVQDADETGRNGVTVELYNDKNERIGTTVTADLDGKPGYYQFDKLDAGKYQVRFLLPSDSFTFTEVHQGGALDLDSDADPSTGYTGLISLGIGEKNMTVDAGLIEIKEPKALGKIGDFVWLDKNANGIQDIGEEGLNGVTVELYDAAGKLLATAKTESAAFKAGHYLFTDLPEGEYRLRFITPDGYVLTTSKVGGDAYLDSNPNAEGWTDLIKLGEEETNLSIDAGLVSKNPSVPGQPTDPNKPTQPQKPSKPGDIKHPPGSPNQGGGSLPQTGEEPSMIPWIGLALCLMAGSLLLIRKYS